MVTAVSRRRTLCSMSTLPPPCQLIADLQVLPSPLGTQENQYKHVDAAIAAIASSGLEHSVNALGTTIQGPADDVWATARAAFDAAIASGATSEMMVLKVYQGETTVDALQTSGRAAAATAAAAAAATDTIAAPEKVSAEEDDTAPPRGTKVVHAGSRELPPLIEVPGGSLPLAAVVKPPDADALWQWEANRGNADADPSWASVWPAAANLAHLLQRDGSIVRGKRVAELGAGLGVPGLTAAQCGARSVTLIDKEPYALHCAMSTAVVCGLETGPVPTGEAGAESAAGGANGGDAGVVSASVADWGALAREGLTVDVVLASEVLYDEAEAAPLVRCAAALLGKGGTLLLADPADARVERARAVAVETLTELGARVTEESLPAPPAGDGWYTVRPGDGAGAMATEPIVLLRAEF